MEIFYLQQDKGQDSRPLFSECVPNEVSVYIWELTRGSNSLIELPGLAKVFFNIRLRPGPTCFLRVKVESISQNINTTSHDMKWYV